MAKYLSDRTKYALAREMGVAHLIKGNYYGYLSSRDCGRFVQKAIELAERAMR
ncbi:MAG: Small, acid-soluble spore protein, alpha/be [Clostridia bacterium 62_21]|nr:MAG: Small, acid-soluble spore protein, alpha/be [Clostridia bacterium 62_21]HAG07021.1 small, acid-soluble spore protein, alpha/beta type [Peptococcaceae bacterium]